MYCSGFVCTIEHFGWIFVHQKSQKAMGAAGSSDFVDPETLPLQILLAEEVRLEKNGKEQNVVDARDQDNDKLLKEYWQLRHEKKYWMDFAQQMEKERNWFGFISLTSPLNAMVWEDLHSSQWGPLLDLEMVQDQLSLLSQTLGDHYVISKAGSMDTISSWSSSCLCYGIVGRQCELCAWCFGPGLSPAGSQSTYW